EQAARTPDRIALMCGDRQISYRELDASANRVSSQLRKLGAGPGMTVGIYAERSLESVTGVLSVLKAGCACLPLDPDYPAERLAFMIEEVDPPVLLTQTHLAKRLPARRSRILCLDEPGLEHTDLVEGDSDVHVSAGAAAYVIYTSGSSGQPKAVVIDHRHIVNRLAWMWNTYPFDSDDVGCQKCSLSFLDSIWEIFVALLKGVPTAIIMDHELKDLNMFVARLAQHHVTRVIQIVPSLLRVLLHTFPDLERRLPEVKLWLTSGEELSVDLYQRYRERLPQSTLCNVYGCSEATGTWYEPKAGENQGARFPIGRPIANIRTYVLDQHLQAVPVGVTGELYFGGVSVARGYLNRPRLSREKFFTHSFDGIDAQRLYKTGDLVRWRSDGHIEFIGRVDNQVKLRGSRIELGEIEAALCAHPAVSESIVTLFEERPGDGRLIAYVAAAEAPLRPAELRASLKRKLPTHMLPPVIMVLESLPLNANGKVNRNALPMPDPGRQDLYNSFVAPRTVVEKALAFIWSDLLKVDQIGIDDDFFELGGHSIQAMQVVSRVRDTLGVELALRSLFDVPTVIGLAEVVEAARESGTHRINPHTGPRFA
ncbi:amino acid adenylation domain-containing protein, partial [Pseudomonadota bacterium]